MESGCASCVAVVSRGKQHAHKRADLHAGKHNGSIRHIGTEVNVVTSPMAITATTTSPRPVLPLSTSSVTTGLFTASALLLTRRLARAFEPQRFSITTTTATVRATTMRTHGRSQRKREARSARSPSCPCPLARATFARGQRVFLQQ